MPAVSPFCAGSPPRADSYRSYRGTVGQGFRHIETVEEPNHPSFLDVLRTRLATSWLALEAAQAAVPQFGARGYLVGAEAGHRLREAQFVAIVTPSIRHIATELAKD